MGEITENPKELLNRIKELEAENKKLKTELRRLKSKDDTFYTLKKDTAAFVDLGDIKEELPTSIPDHKKWKASEYPKEWPPEKKVEEYLKTYWNNYPVTQSYFSNVKGGQAFYKYLQRNEMLHMVPTSFQLKLKKAIG